MKARALGLFEEARRLDRAGQLEPALAAYRAFLKVEPGSAEGWAGQGGLLLALGRLPEARQACHRALRLDQANRPALANLASVLVATGQVDPAEALCRRILAQAPGDVDGRLGLGDCLIRRGDFVQARALLRETCALAPGNRAVTRMLKYISASQGDWTELRTDMMSELETFTGPERDHEEAHLRLMFGEFERGWALNESRLRVPGLIAPVRNFTEPVWQGRPFPDQTLLLHWEQGFGDTLMFMRYAPMAKALGGRVLLSVQPELAELAATCAGVDQVLAHGEPLPPFDFQASLLSLPHVFRTGLDSIPARIPYLDVPARVPNRAAIAELLAASEGRTRIGLVWAGSRIHKRDAERSLAPGLLAPLAGLPGVAWHSFQLGQEQAPPLPGLVPLGPLLGNFSDTAYALSGMDLVIAVDTAIIHLAGALGIPTLALVAFCPDFRWLLDRDDSPWYPTLRLYRQPVPDAWAPVIQQVLKDLSA